MQQSPAMGTSPGFFNEFWYYKPAEISKLSAKELGQASVGPTSTDSAKLVGIAGTSSQELDDNISSAGNYRALSLGDFRFVSDAQEIQAIEQLVERIAKRAKRRFYGARYRLPAAQYPIRVEA